MPLVGGWAAAAASSCFWRSAAFAMPATRMTRSPPDVGTANGCETSFSPSTVTSAIALAPSFGRSVNSAALARQWSQHERCHQRSRSPAALARCCRWLRARRERSPCRWQVPGPESRGHESATGRACPARTPLDNKPVSSATRNVRRLMVAPPASVRNVYRTERLDRWTCCTTRTSWRVWKARPALTSSGDCRSAA